MEEATHLSGEFLSEDQELKIEASGGDVSDFENITEDQYKLIQHKIIQLSIQSQDQLQDILEAWMKKSTKESQDKIKTSLEALIKKSISQSQDIFETSELQMQIKLFLMYKPIMIAQNLLVSTKIDRLTKLDELISTPKIQRQYTPEEYELYANGLIDIGETYHVYESPEFRKEIKHYEKVYDTLSVVNLKLFGGKIEDKKLSELIQIESYLQDFQDKEFQESMKNFPSLKKALINTISKWKKYVKDGILEENKQQLFHELLLKSSYVQKSSFVSKDLSIRIREYLTDADLVKVDKSTKFIPLGTNVSN